MGRLLDIADRAARRRTAPQPTERQMITFAVHETTNKLTDIAFLGSMHYLLKKHSGADVARATIYTLDGDAEMFDWDVQASNELRTALDGMLAERGEDIAIGIHFGDQVHLEE